MLRLSKRQSPIVIKHCSSLLALNANQHQLSEVITISTMSDCKKIQYFQSTFPFRSFQLLISV